MLAAPPQRRSGHNYSQSRPSASDGRTLLDETWIAENA
jgi:hypothetical protein